jgi:hypothetical protein
VTLSKVYVAIATLVHSAIVLLADAASSHVPSRRILSLLLVGIAVWLFAVTRRSLS